MLTVFTEWTDLTRFTGFEQERRQEEGQKNFGAGAFVWNPGVTSSWKGMNHSLLSSYSELTIHKGEPAA